MTPLLHNIIFSMGIGRIALGLAPFVAPARAAQLVGFPTAQDNPTARLMGRYFGVRDIGLGILTFGGLRHPEHLGFILLFNALMDAGDLVATAIPLVLRQGIDRAAWRAGALAGSAMLAWTTMWLLTRAH